VSWSPAHPDEFALGRGEERVLLFACTHFGRFVPMRRRTPHIGHYPDARLNGFDFADPPRLRLEEPYPEYEPTSDVPCHHRGTISSAPPTRTLATADRLATTRVLHRSDQKRAPPARLRATSHHSRTPSAVSRTMSCDSVETRMRIRPRESSLSRPFAPASFVPPHRRGGCELLRG